jgi:hypothetical protein
MLYLPSGYVILQACTQQEKLIRERGARI